VQEGVGPYGPRLSWTFIVTNGDDGERALRAYTSQAFSPRSKLWAWLDALLYKGRGIPADLKQVDTASVIGRPCRVEVAVKEGDSGTFNHVAAILPPTNGAVRPATEEWPL